MRVVYSAEPYPRMSDYAGPNKPLYFLRLNAHVMRIEHRHEGDIYHLQYSARQLRKVRAFLRRYAEYDLRINGWCVDIYDNGYQYVV